MAARKKTWEEKLHIESSPHVERVEKAFGGLLPGQLMLVPTPLLVDAYIRQLPQGKAIDLNTLRRDLASEYHAEVTCPLTTGIFLRIVAEAAYEQFQKGKPLSQITPFWRVIGPESNTAKKLSFGTDFLNAQRSRENIATSVAEAKKAGGARRKAAP